MPSEAARNSQFSVVRMRFEDPDDNRALRIVRTFIEKKNPKVDGGREAKTIERTVPGEDVDSLQEQDSSSGNNPETVYPNNHSRLHWTRIRASYRKIAAKLSSNDDISYRY